MPGKKTSGLLASTLVLVATLAHAQAALPGLPGYVVTNQGDTLRGLVQVPRVVTEKGVGFRATEQAEAQHFGVSDVRSFGLQDGRQFVRRTLAAGRNPITGRVDSAAVFLQYLVGGAANFYRYEAGRQATATAYDPAEPVQFFMDVAGSGLFQVRRATQQAALTAAFHDCPAVVEAVPRTLFDEHKLGNLVLRYNTECHANIPAHDYRLPEAPGTVQVLVSLRGGMQRGKLYYPSSNYLVQSNAQAATLPTYGLELRLAYHGPWSLIAGVHYARLRSEAVAVQTAQQGTANAGQSLSLPYKAEVQSLQAPVLVRFTAGRALLRPYIAAGAMYGMYSSNHTTLSYTTLTRVNSTATPYRNDVVTADVQNPKSTSPTVSGVVRLGLQFKTKTRLSPLLEVQYVAGSDSENNPGLTLNSFGTTENIGSLHYQAYSILAGLEF